MPSFSKEALLLFFLAFACHPHCSLTLLKLADGLPTDDVVWMCQLAAQLLRHCGACAVAGEAFGFPEAVPGCGMEPENVADGGAERAEFTAPPSTVMAPRFPSERLRRYRALQWLEVLVPGLRVDWRATGAPQP